VRRVYCNGHPLVQVRYAVQSALPPHAVSTPVRQVPPSTASALSKHVSHESGPPSAVAVNVSVAQYSVAHVVPQGPAPQTHDFTSATRSWKPVAWLVWQQAMQAAWAWTWHVWSLGPASTTPLLLPELPLEPELPPLPLEPELPLLPELPPEPELPPLPLLPELPLEPELLPLACAQAVAACDCTAVQLEQPTQMYGLPSTVYVMDEHAPFASEAVHTVIELPSEHVVPVVHVGPPLPLLLPEPPLEDPLPHAFVASDSAWAQSWQLAHWNDPPPTS